MPRQQGTVIENNFSKGLVTSATGMNFPQNAVTDASNCTFDFLGTVSRREGFDLEQGNVPKQVDWTGQAISSFLWHNVTGDNTLNIYVVQIGGKLYFYPVSNTGAAVSPQIDSSLPLDFSSFSSQAINSLLIPATTGTPIGDLSNLGASFDSNLNQTFLQSSNDGGVNLGTSINQNVIHYVGKNYGTAAPPKIGTASIYPSTDAGLVATNYTYNAATTVNTYPYNLVNGSATIVYMAGVQQQNNNWQAGQTVTGQTSGATGIIASGSSSNTAVTGTINLTTSNNIPFQRGEFIQNLSSGTVVTVANVSSYTKNSDASATIGSPVTTSSSANTTVPFAATRIVNLRAKNTTAPSNSSDGVLLAQGNYTGGVLTLTSNNQNTNWQYVWFEIFVGGLQLNVPANSNTGTITTGGIYDLSLVGTTTSQTIVNYSPVSIAEGMGVSEVRFFSPQSFIGSPFVNNFECQYSTGLGFLFVTHPWCYPFVVQYTAGTPPTYTATPIAIQVRDFDGVDDGLQLATGVTNNIATRPAPTGYAIVSQTGVSSNSPNPLYNGAAYINLHLYNLQNQGWSPTNLNTWLSTFGSSLYPSNCDVWWYLKNSSGIFTPSNINNVDVGSTPAPKGSFIFDAFYVDRGAVVGSTTSNSAPGAGSIGITHSNLNRPSTVSFYSGRVFYSGVNYPNYSNCIWFTQVLSPTSSTIIPSLGQCYQTNDPTSSQFFDLLTTDGGVIRIPDCGTIVKLFPIQGALVVFATNGIWTVSGSKGGLGFTADDYSVNKLSSIKCLSGQSVVDVQGMPFFWTNEGIYTMKIDVQSGGIKVDSLTYSTIDEFYKAIPRANKAYARGFFNPGDYTIQWLYRNAPATVLPDHNYQFDSVLVFNTITGAFYPYTISTGKVNAASIVVLETGLETDVTPADLTYTFKYFVTYSNPTSGLPQINIADMFSTQFVDWKSYDNIGQSYESTFTSGYRLVGQGIRRGLPDYIYVYLNDEIINNLPNSYKIQSIRDFGSDRSSGRWSSVNVYSEPTTHYSNFIRRHRLRGRGLVIQFKITSFQNHPFDLLGWGIWSSVGAQP